MPGKDHRDDVRRLAQAIRSRLTEHDRLPGRRIKIDPELSKILANEDAVRAEHAIEHPGVFTMRDIARRLGTTVSELLGEPTLGEDDRKKLEQFVELLVNRFGLFEEVRNLEARAIPIDLAGFVEREHDYPRPHHAWLLRSAAGAAGVTGRESDDHANVELTEVLHSIRHVENKRMQVIRVIGDSMANILRHDDKVLVDTNLKSPRKGDVVAVYIHAEGGVLGYWRSERGEFWLDKENDAVPSIRLGHAVDWTLWGTVTRVVDKPVLPRASRSSR